MKAVIYLALVLLTAAPALALAKALEPTVMLGPACGPGSARNRQFLVFEDRDGDGGYDFITAYDCNGDVRGRPWGSVHESEAPWIPLQTDFYFGHLSNDVVSINRSLSYTELPSGLYTWTLTEYGGTGAGPGPGVELCSSGRNSNGNLWSTCQAEDENLE